MRRRAFVIGAGIVMVSRPSRAAALAHFSTSYAIDAEHKSRASNVQLAAEAIDGKKIAAGATFSFNDAVGERTAAFGYAKALVLRDGMLAEGSGGGACQVASTLHTAALLAGLDIAARAPHSRPSAYIRMGFDATVAYPKIDLKLTNPTDAEVVIRAKAANGNLDIALEGGTKSAVTLTSEILDRTPYSRTLERDRTMGPDEARRTAFGIPGYRIRRVRTIETRRDVRIDTYLPVSEIIKVAPSFDEARLGPPEDEEHEAMAKVTIVNAPDAQKPLLVQLRPSTLVTLDNR